MNSSTSGSTWERNKDRLLVGSILLLMIYSAVRNTLKASIRHFWFDELCTWIMVHQPNWATLWNALTRAADSQPPPFYLIEKFFNGIIPNEHIAFRMPSILGFCCLQWCLFVLVKRRYGTAIAFITSLIPFLTPLYSIYAVEARGYSLATASLSLALVAYQKAPLPRWMFLLALSLAAAQSSHFYSFIMMTPIFAAETLFFLKTKSFRWQVWTAFACGISPLLFFWPILSRIKGYYTEHPWMHPTMFGTLRLYGWILGIQRGTAEGFSWSLVVWLSIAASCIAIAAILIYRALRSNPNEDPLFQENVLAAGFLLLPLLLFVVIKITHGVLAPRYLLSVTFGLVLLAARGLSRLNPKSVLVIGGCLCASIAILDASFWFSYYGDSQMGFLQPKPVEQLVSKAGHADLPVVTSDGHDYLESEHYATPEWKKRLTFLADYPAALAYGRSDFNDKELLVLRDFAPLRVFDYDKFKVAHSEFLLYSNPAEENDPDWFVLWLLADGWSLQKLTSSGHTTVYLAKLRSETH